MSIRSKDRGNALFLILIAVALFAALSYAVTQSGRGSGGASKEQAILSVAQMTQFGSAIQNAITRLKIMNVCTDGQFSFEKPPFDGSDTDYINVSSPIDHSCHIFHPNGGGAPYQTSPAGISSDTAYIFAMDNRVIGVGTTDWSYNDQELLLMLGNMDEDVCTSINAQFLQISGIPSDLGTTGGGPFNALPSDVGADISACCGNVLNNAIAGCIRGGTNTPANYFVFYQVVLAR